MESLLKYINQHASVSIEAINSLTQKLKRLDLKKNSYLITEGKICHQVYFLESGCLRGFYKQGRKEISYWFGFENSFVTSFYSFITRKPTTESIQLIEDCTFWSISYDDLQLLYRKHPDLERLGRIMIEQYYVMLEERFLSLHFKESKDRYENLIAKNPHILQRVPLGFIASYLGITQETLSRIRKQY